MRCRVFNLCSSLWVQFFRCCCCCRCRFASFFLSHLLRRCTRFEYTLNPRLLCIMWNEKLAYVGSFNTFSSSLFPSFSLFLMIEFLHFFICFFFFAWWKNYAHHVKIITNYFIIWSDTFLLWENCMSYAKLGNQPSKMSPHIVYNTLAWRWNFVGHTFINFAHCLDAAVSQYCVQTINVVRHRGAFLEYFDSLWKRTNGPTHHIAFIDTNLVNNLSTIRIGRRKQYRFAKIDYGN